MKSMQSVRNEVSPRPAKVSKPEPFAPSQVFQAGDRDAANRAAAILWIRMQMVRNGISYEDLVRAGCFDESASSKVARYRSADGRTWDGLGEQPDWLQRAVNAGQTIEHFRIE